MFFVLDPFFVPKTSGQTVGRKLGRLSFCSGVLLPKNRPSFWIRFFFSFWVPVLFQKRVAKKLAENLAELFLFWIITEKIGRKISMKIGRGIGKTSAGTSANKSARNIDKDHRQEHRQDNRCVLNIDCLVFLFARFCFLCKTIKSAHRQTRCEEERERT